MRTPVRRRQLALPALTAVLLVGGWAGPAGRVAGVQDRSAGASSEMVPPTGFGGYSWWSGRVDQVSAEWEVPPISASSASGHASTWVGAQNPEGGFPFIQLGVTEDNAGPGLAQYHLFWSDTKVGFHPQYLGRVEAGDLISADMARDDAGWRLTIRDLTRGQEASKTVEYAPGADFGQAEWLQEDPTASTTVAWDLPYPTMADERFEDVRVDGRVPHLGLGNGQTLMATGGTVLVPTPFRHDAFAMVAPAGAGGQYLHDAEPLDFAINDYNFELGSWPKLALRDKVDQVQALVRAYALFTDAIADQRWPTGARHDIALLATDDAQLNAALTAWQWSGLSRSSLQFAQLEEDQDNDLGQLVRQDLGLPRA